MYVEGCTTFCFASLVSEMLNTPSDVHKQIGEVPVKDCKA